MIETTINTDIVNKEKGKIEKNIVPLRKYIQNSRILLPELKNVGGIYVFWWIGEKEKLTEALLNCDYRLKGKKSEKELIVVKFTKDWINLASLETKEICLYVGKSTNIRDRISKHIKLGTNDIWGKVSKKSGQKPNTVSQLRIGLERVFDRPIFENLIENIGVSWIILDEYQNGINRFYLEDYFIGKYFPIFNIDIER